LELSDALKIILSSEQNNTSNDIQSVADSYIF